MTSGVGSKADDHSGDALSCYARLRMVRWTDVEILREFSDPVNAWLWEHWSRTTDGSHQAILKRVADDVTWMSEGYVELDRLSLEEQLHRMHRGIVVGEQAGHFKGSGARQVLLHMLLLVTTAAQGLVVSLSQRDAAKGCSIHRETAAKAFKTLQELGWIELSDGPRGGEGTVWKLRLPAAVAAELAQVTEAPQRLAKAEGEWTSAFSRAGALGESAGQVLEQLLIRPMTQGELVAATSLDKATVSRTVKKLTTLLGVVASEPRQPVQLTVDVQGLQQATLAWLERSEVGDKILDRNARMSGDQALYRHNVDRTTMIRKEQLTPEWREAKARGYLAEDGSVDWRRVYVDDEKRVWVLLDGLGGDWTCEKTGEVRSKAWQEERKTFRVSASSTVSDEKRSLADV